MCRCCQNCLENLYWNCIEDRFCFDKSIAEFDPDEDEFCEKNGAKIITNSQNNNNLSPIRSQPLRRNESSLFSHAKIHEEDVRREIQTSVPILAPEIIAVFNNSQIFQDSQKLSRVNTKNVITPIPSANKDALTNEQEKLIFQLEGHLNEQNKRDKEASSNKQTTTIIKDKVNEKTPNEIVNDALIEKKLTFTISNDSPLEILPKSPSIIFPIIPEKDEDVVDDIGTEFFSNNLNFNIFNQSSLSIKNNSTETNSNDFSELKDEVVLRPKFNLSNDNRTIKEQRPLRNVQSMPYIKHVPVRSVASETDIFFISGSGLYGQLSMTPEVPSISYSNLPKNYEDTPTLEKYKEHISLYKLQTSNREKADSKIVDYSMPRYFKKTLAHSTSHASELSINMHRKTLNRENSKENLSNFNSGILKFEKSKRLKQLRDNLPPLKISHRFQHKKEDIK